MRVLSFLLILAMLLSFAACGTDPAPVDSADDSTDSTPAETTPAETEPPEEPDPSYTATKEGFEVMSEDGSYKLVFSDASVVMQGEEGDQAWGHYQFPTLTFSTEGLVIANWLYTSDTIEYKGSSGSKISPNNGNFWVNMTAMDKSAPKQVMGNGKAISFYGKGAYTADYLNEYESALAWGSEAYRYKMFFLEDFLTDTRENVIEDTTLDVRIYDPETGVGEKIAAKVNWPYAPLTQHPGTMVYPFRQVFVLSSRALRIIDGIPYLCLYTRGFDSTASSREEAMFEYARYPSAYIFKSEDYGYTWDFVSQVSITDAVYEESRKTPESAGSFEGFCEPDMTVMPDGSVVMLLRTGSNNPSYIVRSTDMCKTWSEPVKFDDLGVLPQIESLECGVTVAFYGRPELRFRATDDPSGLAWDDPVEMPLTNAGDSNHMNISCFNTDMLILDEDTVMIIYTDFHYPNKNGVGVKTVLTRTVDVVMLDE